MTETRPRAAVQLYDNLAQLGLVHVMWLTQSQAICTAAEALLAARAKRRGARVQAPGSHGFTDGGGTSTGRRALRNVQYNESAAMAALGAANEVAAQWRRNTISDVEGGPHTAATAADLGCVWYSQAFNEQFNGHRKLMMKRIMLLTRAVRQGYNLLSLDSDVILFREPYVFLKMPPYTEAHMVVGKSIRGGSMVNTGVMYFQNVSRTGPVSWLLTETVERNLRWLEPQPSQAGVGGVPLLTPHEAERRGCWDQLLFGDAVLTSITGKLSLFYCVRPPERLGDNAVAFAAKMAGRKSEEDVNSWAVRHRNALGLTDRQGPSDLLAVRAALLGSLS